MCQYGFRFSESLRLDESLADRRFSMILRQEIRRAGEFRDQLDRFETPFQRRPLRVWSVREDDPIGDT